MEHTMKITRIRTRVVDLPLPGEFYPAWARGRIQPSIVLVVIEVETDAGITGLGAAHAGGEAAIAIERFVSPYLIGQDPTRIEVLTKDRKSTRLNSSHLGISYAV